MRLLFNRVAYKVKDDSDLDDLKIKIENKGIETKFLEAGSVTDCGRVLAFVLPSGHEMHLYAHKEFLGKDTGEYKPSTLAF